MGGVLGKAAVMGTKMAVKAGTKAALRTGGRAAVRAVRRGTSRAVKASGKALTSKITQSGVRGMTKESAKVAARNLARKGGRYALKQAKTQIKTLPAHIAKAGMREGVSAARNKVKGAYQKRKREAVVKKINDEFAGNGPIQKTRV